MTKKIARIEVRIPPDIKTQFSSNCVDEGKNSSEVIRDFIYGRLTGNSDNLTDNATSEKFLTKNVWLCLSVLIFVMSVFFYFPAQVSEQQKLTVQFKRLDDDGNRQLTIDDFKSYKAAKIKSLKRKQKRFIKQHGVEAATLSLKIKKTIKKYKPKSYMEYYDANNNGEVSFAEFSALPPKNTSIRWGGFNSLNSNDDRYLNYEELLHYAEQWFKFEKLTHKKSIYCVEEILLNDMDGDKRLSLEEYNEALVNENF